MTANCKILRFKILINTFFQIAGKFISSGFGFLTTILIARFYSVSDFGEYIKIISFGTAFWIMGDFGLNAIAIREYHGGGSVTDKFNRLLTLRIILSLVLMFVCVSLLAFLPAGYGPIAKLGIIIFSFTILSQNIHLTANSVFQQNLAYQKTLYALIITNLTSFVIIALAVWQRWPLLAVIFSFSVAGIALIIASLFFVKQYVGQIVLQFDFPEMRKMMFKAAPLGLVLIFNVIYFHIDSFLLASMKTSREVGLYGLAYKFFETALVVPTFYGNSVYPVLLTRLKNDTEGFHRLFRKSLLLLTGGSILMTAAFLVLSPLFIRLSTNSSAYAGAVSALQILSLSFPVFFLSAIFMWYYVSLNKKAFLLFVYGSSLIVNLILNLIFIPRFSYVAAATITGVSELYILLIFIWFYLHNLKCKIK